MRKGLYCLDRQSLVYIGSRVQTLLFFSFVRLRWVCCRIPSKDYRVIWVNKGVVGFSDMCLCLLD
jgi:hypothetical protein